ncbi:hypothetical protein INT43_000704 [Umbelopsis isabellina]|uniref:SET domain-containing protein n=1 Tax=Mortierella isabellina TaxID=91625 RepID=A0A8H7UGD7_MORIS|nr:hypothetical protein INT43_000704 [Umbelopsis isabellina]
MLRFLDYLSNTEKVELLKVAVKETDTAGNGLFASDELDCHKGSSLLTIPSQLIITAQTAREFFKEKFPAIYQELDEVSLGAVKERFILLAFLIYGHSNPSEFPYQAYLDVLPTATDFEKWHALYFDDEHLKIMDGSSLAASIEARHQVLKKEVHNFRHHVRSFPEDVSLELWKWADTIFWTRVISIKSQHSASKIPSDSQSDYALVPMIDFANHSLKPNVRWEINEDGDFQLFPKDDIQIKAGDELFLSYGDKSNQELLFSHGFCIPDNPTSAKFTISAASLLSFDEDSYQAKFHWLRKIGYQNLALTLEKEAQGMWHPLLKAGWTVESVKLLHFAVLSLSEDDLIVTTEEDSVTEDGVNIVFDNVNLKDMDQSFEIIQQHKNYPVYQLRTVLILSDALEYHFNTLAMSLQEQDDSLDQNDQTKSYISMYATEELELLSKALTIMDEEKAKLAENEVVITYLGQDEDAI